MGCRVRRHHCRTGLLHAAASGSRRRALASIGRPTTGPPSARKSRRGAPRPTRAAISRRRHRPEQRRHVYVSGSQNLWQSRDGGSHLAHHVAVRRSAGNVDVARDQRQQRGHRGRSPGVRLDQCARGHRGPADGRDLHRHHAQPAGRNVARRRSTPTIPRRSMRCWAGSVGFPEPGHVFRTTLGGSAWTDISPPLDLPFSAIALDGTEMPTTLYVGTDLGVLRSVDGGGIVVRARRSSTFRACRCSTLSFGTGFCARRTYGRGVFAFVKPTGPAIAVDLEDNLAFGTVCQGPQYLTLRSSTSARRIWSSPACSGSWGRPVFRCCRRRHAAGRRSGRGHRVHGGVQAHAWRASWKPHDPHHQQRSGGARCRPVGHRHARDRDGSLPRSRTAAISATSASARSPMTSSRSTTRGTCPLSIFNIASSSPDSWRRAWLPIRCWSAPAAVDRA